MSNERFREGDFYRISDITGRKILASKTRRQWDGLIVGEDEWSERHPQDVVRTRADRQMVEDPRPRPTDVFVLPGDGPFIFVSTQITMKTFEVTSAQFYAYDGVVAQTASGYPKSF